MLPVLINDVPLIHPIGMGPTVADNPCDCCALQPAPDVGYGCTPCGVQILGPPGDAWSVRTQGIQNGSCDQCDLINRTGGLFDLETSCSDSVLIEPPIQICGPSSSIRPDIERLRIYSEGSGVTCRIYMEYELGYILSTDKWAWRGLLVTNPPDPYTLPRSIVMTELLFNQTTCDATGSTATASA